MLCAIFNHKWIGYWDEFKSQGKVFVCTRCGNFRLAKIPLPAPWPEEMIQPLTDSTLKNKN